MPTSLLDHAIGIRRYDDVRTEYLKGTNTKVKRMKCQAYEFRDQDFFKLKIQAIHETKYAFVG